MRKTKTAKSESDLNDLCEFCFRKLWKWFRFFHFISLHFVLCITSPRNGLFNGTKILFETLFEKKKEHKWTRRALNARRVYVCLFVVFFYLWLKFSVSHLFFLRVVNIFDIVFVSNTHTHTFTVWLVQCCSF